MEKIVDYLKQLELSEIEAKLYLTLLQTGPISVRDLAASIDIKRTTAYLYVDQLVEKGLVLKLVKGSHKLISANSPESLQSLVEQKINTADNLEQDLSKIVSLLSAKIPEAKDFDQAEIRYYQGKLAVKKIYEEALAGSEFRLYAHMVQLGALLFPSDLNLDFDLFENALTKNPKLKIYEIISDEDKNLDEFKLENTTQTNRYQYKFMPSHVNLTAPGILLYDNKVAMITGGEKINSIVLHNVDYYVNSVKLFDFIWEVLPKSKTR